MLKSTVHSGQVCLYANGVKINQWKAIESEFKKCPLCLGVFQKSLLLITWKNGLQEYVYDYSVRYKTLDVSDMEDIPQYLVRKHNTVEILGVINQIFTLLEMMLCFAGSLAIKLVSMNN